MAPFTATAQAALDSAGDAIVALDRDMRVVLWNPAAERMFGWSAAEAIGHPLRTVPDEHMAEHRAVLERVLSGGQITLNTRRVRRDGGRIDVHAVVSAMRDDGGAAIGWVAVFHPIAEDDAARHTTAERARVVRRLGDVVADIGGQLELSTVLDRIAASLRELTGADAGGFVLIEADRLRLVSMDGLPEKLRGATADLRTSLVGELLRMGKTVMLATADTRSLGDLIWSQLPGLHTIALAVAGVADRPYGALYALYSKRSIGHVELELLELLAGHAGVALSNAMAYTEVVRQRAHERAVIDASADGIAVLDPDGMVRQWNPAAVELTGYSADEVIGKPPPFDLPAPGEKSTQLLDNGRWLDVLCATIPDGCERVVDFRDITATKALEAEKDLFLATASHELRTPITVVRGFASTLVNRWDQLSEQDRRSAVQIIAERAGTLAELVEQLLLGSRAGTGEIAVSSEPFDLARLLRGTTVAFASLSAHHELSLDLPDGLPHARGDVMATDVIIGQLLENAVKYSPAGGDIVVAARERDARIVVTVTDEGIGIAPGDHERIFDRFVQGDAGDRRRFGGIGLGLFIVRRLARAQGGEVTAHSRPEGGAILRFELPAACPAG